MFGLLFQCSPDEQRNVAAQALSTYVGVWNEKQKDAASRRIPAVLLTNRDAGDRPKLPEFPEGLDPADAEFENGLIEFYNGAYFRANQTQRTLHFASAIRSAVTARQIDRWIRDYPGEYGKWRAGQGFDGPTFLDDETAAAEAEKGWVFVDDVLIKQHTIASKPSAERYRFSRQIETLYKRWEESVL